MKLMSAQFSYGFFLNKFVLKLLIDYISLDTFLKTYRAKQQSTCILSSQ